MGRLELIREFKIHRLLPGHAADSPLEASGVLAREGHLLVIFDNVSQVARIETSLEPAVDNGWLGSADGARGHEDIAYNPRQQRFYVLVEAVLGEDGAFRAEIAEHDRDFTLLERHVLPFDLDRANKGFEGLACVQRDGDDYVLALCEGNWCKGGQEGRQPGNGRIQIFRRAAGWHHVAELALPPAAAFTDYSSIDVRDERVAILSQESSQLWVGQLSQTDWTFLDAGVVYGLPGGRRAKPLYCNAEGVSWLAPDLIAVVSDRMKKDDPRRCARKDMSVHVFRIP